MAEDLAGRRVHDDGVELASRRISRKPSWLAVFDLEVEAAGRAIESTWLTWPARLKITSAAVAASRTTPTSSTCASMTSIGTGGAVEVDAIAAVTWARARRPPSPRHRSPTSASARFEPMKPSPPVTRHRRPAKEERRGSSRAVSLPAECHLPGVTPRRSCAAERVSPPVCEPYRQHVVRRPSTGARQDRRARSPPGARAPRSPAHADGEARQLVLDAYQYAALLT